MKVNAELRDIVDTEHSTGDVNKMLLGSFVEEYDHDEDESDEISTGDSTGSPQYFNERTLSPETSVDEEVFDGDSLPPSLQPNEPPRSRQRAKSFR